MATDQMQQYVVSGLEATRFKLVRSLDELKLEFNYFLPDMCHQVFGENETIFGYRNLKININYDAATFKCYVDYTYDEKLENDTEINLPTENIMEKLGPWLPENFITVKQDFVDIITNKNKPKPFGKLLEKFNIVTENEEKRYFEIYTCNSKESDYRDFHQRMETLIVWFIDAANFIDVTDDKWQFFILYEKVLNNDKMEYFPVGYSTVYEYFAYPESRRYRISQFIIFPPYQNIGLGSHLLKTVHQFLISLANIYDITVEDPSEKFQSIRDYLDAKNCLTLPVFNLPFIKADFSKEMIEEARNRFKINEKQSRRIHEILRLYHTDVDNESEYNLFKIMVKNKLNAPFKKQQQRNKKCAKYFKEMPQLQSDHTMKIIEKEFQHLIKQYRHVIFRLQNHSVIIKDCITG